ncbi:Hypothetical_protein [Hexamita inflata]|uniref:Hypothetical_protein n=1 Tax=Hexamita inflata TaxID=28002 RepID=A0AA86TYA9_9EUKA|nr:Hypothetical protein HINF_LOCUS12813 [Hexamita inflata]
MQTDQLIDELRLQIQDRTLSIFSCQDLFNIEFLNEFEIEELLIKFHSKTEQQTNQEILQPSPELQLISVTESGSSGQEDLDLGMCNSIFKSIIQFNCQRLFQKY